MCGKIGAVPNETGITVLSAVGTTINVRADADDETSRNSTIYI